MNIFVGVAHPIKIIKGATFNSSIRKYQGGEVTHIFPVTKVLNAKLKVTKVGGFDGVPDFRREVVSIDSYPEGYDVVVVSMVYALAYRTKYNNIPSTMRVISDVVVSDDGNRIGCLGFSVV